MARLSGGFAAYADTHAAASTARAWSTWNRLCARLTQLGAMAGNPMDGVPRAKVPRPGPHAFTDTDMSTLLDTVRDGRVLVVGPASALFDAVDAAPWLVPVGALRAEAVDGIAGALLDGGRWAVAGRRLARGGQRGRGGGPPRPRGA